MAIPTWASGKGLVYLPLLTQQINKAIQDEALWDGFTTLLKGAQGKRKGDIFTWTVTPYVEGDTAEIAEDELTPRTNVLPEQMSLTIGEYGHSFPWTKKFEVLAQIDIKSIYGQLLKEHAIKTIDNVVGLKFREAPLKYVPTGSYAAPTYIPETTLTTVATRNLKMVDFFNLAEELSRYRIKPRANGRWASVWDRRAIRGFKGDPLWQDVQLRLIEAGKPSGLLTGYIGTFDKFDIYQSDNDIVFPPLQGTGGDTSLPPGRGVVFGEDAVYKAVAEPVTILSDFSKDFGRDRALAWFFMGGWKSRYPTATARFFGAIEVTSAF